MQFTQLNQPLRPFAALTDTPFGELTEVDEQHPQLEETLYGMEQVLSFGYLPLSGKKFQGRFASKVRDVFEHRLDYPIEIVLRSWRNISKSGIILAKLEHNAKLPLMLKRRGIEPFRSAKIVVLNCWLAERLSTLSEWKRAEWLDLLKYADAITVWSENQVEILSDFGVRRELIRPVTFGVNPWLKVAETHSPRDIEVLAVGMDPGRDYKTLFEAVAGQPWQVKLACKPVNLLNLEIPQNVEVLGLVAREEYRDLLQRAKVVVVPTRDFAYPTGQSVALEGAMAGAAIVVSNTQPMRQYFTDGVTALMPEVHSVEGLRSAIDRLLTNETFRTELANRGSENTSNKYTNRQMWQEIAAILDEVAPANY